MSLLYPFFLVFLIPLVILYKQSLQNLDKEKKFQRRLLFLSLFFVILALSRPVINSALVAQKFDAQDFIIAIDASYSMQAEDLKPTRYELAKENIQKILTSLNKDRFSLFAFTSNAMLISPPTTDTQLSFIALQTLNPEYILTKGTSLLNLLKTVAKSSYEEKKLIIFSDGGDERNLHELVTFAKENKIIPYIVATSSEKGSLLYKDGKKLTDKKANLVITRANPILKDFATLCSGHYYTLNENDSSVVDDLISDLSSQPKSEEESTIKVVSHSELNSIPIALALISFFIAITKVRELFVLLLLFVIPNHSSASYLDFYYLDKGYASFKTHHYRDASEAFAKVTPSVESYYNLGVSYYKEKEYKNAIKIFSQIKSTDPIMKQKLYYNMGNCATKLQKYERAKIYYQKALALGYDKEAYANLLLVYNIKEKKDISDMLPPTEVKKETQASKKSEAKKDDSKEKKEKNNNSQSSDSKAANEAIQSSDGSASSKGKEKKKGKSSDTINKAKYQIAYKAYELMNEGYTNETHPW